jgi:hypothetical protein
MSTAAARKIDLEFFYDSNRGIIPYQLLHGGHHSDDVGINGRAVMQQ